jgi:hypothetical protein
VVVVVAAFSISAEGGFSAGRGQNFALAGGSGSGLGATTRGPGKKRGGHPVDSMVSQQRRKPLPNLGCVSVAADSAVKMHRLLG